jgi:putative protease
LLSNYFSNRDSNRGECVQACRWEYSINEVNKDGNTYSIEEDDKGTYILNSKDLNLIDYIDEMQNAGIISFKIEGRMKGEYYLATVINAYRRAFDEYYKLGKCYKNNEMFNIELKKTFHRAFTTAYFLGENNETVNYDGSQSTGNSMFICNVLDFDDENMIATVEMRNRFKIGDELEILSPYENFNKKFIVESITDFNGNEVLDAKIVQQKLKIKVPYKLNQGDILRRDIKS